MIDLHARVAVLEDQNERCDEQRTDLAKRLDEHHSILNQVKGGIRLLVVLWTVAVAILGLREFIPARAAAQPPALLAK